MTAAAVILPALGGVIAVLFCVALASPRLPPGISAAATAGLCALAGLGAVVVLLAGGASELRLPIGLGLLPGRLALDPLSAWFVLASVIAGFAAAVADGRRWLPALLGAALLTLLAGDVGLILLAFAAFMALSGANRSGVACVLLIAASLAVLSLGVGTSFAAIRSLPPEGWRAGIVLALLLSGAALLPWAGPFERLASSPGQSVALFTLLPAVSLYVLCRVSLDLCGPATPSWWGVPLLLAGAATACAGALVGLRAPSLQGVLAGMAGLHLGWLMAGVGALAVARAADLLPLATLAGGGTMLHLLNLAVVGSLACVAAEVTLRGAGSQVLDRLGGLAARMPLAGAAMLVAAASLALLPPSAGFASGWMLLQSLFAATRLGGLALHLVLAVTSVALAASAALSVAAMVRLIGTAFLGRPRTPRAAAAEDARRPERALMIGLAAVAVLAGVFPGALVRLAAAAQQRLTHATLESQAGWAGLQVQQGAPGYAVVGVVLLLVAATAALMVVARLRLAGTLSVPVWESGFAPPPPWMPFGDPATQVTAASLASLLPQGAIRIPLPHIRLRLEAEWPLLRPAHGAALLLGLSVVALLGVLLLSPP